MNKKTLPDFIYAAKYMCTECLYQPIYFKEAYCHSPKCAPDCTKTNCKNKNRSCIRNNNQFTDEKNELLEFVNRKCRKPKNKLDRTKEIGIFFLEDIAKEYGTKDVIYEEISESFKKHLYKKFLKIGNAKKYISKRKLEYSDFENLLKHYIIEYNEFHDHLKQKINKITIKGLFGYYSYKFILNEENKISVILGSNAIGKTTIFKLIETIFYDAPEIEDKNYINKYREDKINFLFDLPFDEFEARFFDKRYVKVTKNGDRIIFDYPRNGIDVVESVVINKNSSVTVKRKQFEEHINFVNYMFPRINDFNKFLFIKINRANDLDSIRNKVFSYISNIQDTKINQKKFDIEFSNICKPNLIDDFKKRIDNADDQQKIIILNNIKTLNEKLSYFYLEDDKGKKTIEYNEKKYLVTSTSYNLYTLD